MGSELPVSGVVPGQASGVFVGINLLIKIQENSDDGRNKWHK